MSGGQVVAVKMEGGGEGEGETVEAVTPVKEDPTVRPDSPDTNCAICLETLNNKSFTDRCLHQFCFTCLLEWSKIKQECPLCKKRFMTIIHNVRSEDDYDEFPVHNLNPVEPTVLINLAFQRPPFRYRTTMSGRALVYIDHLRWSRGQETGTGATRLATNDWRRRRQLGTSEFRRNVYRQSLWVRRSSDPRVRQSNPDFYRMNPAQTHRLVPWLNRELNVLLDVSLDSHTICLEILNLITLYPITSGHFHRAISRYLGVRTSHFVHEFYNFATSPYDMLAYDLHAQYSGVDSVMDEVPVTRQESSPSPPLPSAVADHHNQLPTTLPYSSTSDSDSDIEVVGWRPQPLFGLDMGMGMAGPSGLVGPSRLLIEISDEEDHNSDSVEFIDEIPAPTRPAPEVITIDSESEEEGEKSKQNACPSPGGPSSSGACATVGAEVEVGEEEEEVGPRGRKRRRAAANALVKYEFTSTEEDSSDQERRRKHRRKTQRRRHRIKREVMSSSSEEQEEPAEAKEEEEEEEAAEEEEVAGDGSGDREWSRTAPGGVRRLRSVVKVVGQPAWNLRNSRYYSRSTTDQDSSSEHSYR